MTREDGQEYMSFITPLITTIQNVSSDWYNISVCNDKRYEGLTETLDIPILTAFMYYRANVIYKHVSNNINLRDCIRKGDGTPAQLEGLKCTDNMKRYRQSVPGFRYNAAVFPPYGDTIHHWYIQLCDPFKHVSLITDSEEEISNYINNAWGFYLHFVPLPDSLQ